MTSEDRKHVVIAGGGTGGHLFPGVAVVEALQKIDPSIEASFVGTERGIEARVIPKLGYPLHLLDVASLKGAGLGGTLSGLAKLPASGLQARRLVRELDPSIVISVGGYAAGPVTMVAGLMGVPTALMEQNATPGMTNKLLGRVVKKAFLTFEESREFFPNTETEVAGNPVRRSIVDSARDFTYQPPPSEVSKDRPFRILVIGGSGGAGSFNRDIPQWMQAMGEHGELIHIRHQAGRNRADEVVPRYEGFAGRAEVVEFIDDMAEAYRWCDLLICRAGASTIAEVLILGVPAIYIPFPGAADNHQERNALAVVENGGGMMLRDDEIASERSARLLAGLLRNPISLQNIAARARELGKPEAAEAIARQVLTMISDR